MSIVDVNSPANAPLGSFKGLSYANKMQPLLDVEGEDRVRLFLHILRENDLVYGNTDWHNRIIHYVDVVSSDRSLANPTMLWSFKVLPEHCNGYMTMHGGAVSTLFDLTTMLPVGLVSQPGYWMSFGITTSLDCAYLRPISAGDEVYVEAEILSISPTMATVQGVLRRKRDGILAATCRHVMLNSGKKKTPAAKL